MRLSNHSLSLSALGLLMTASAAFAVSNGCATEASQADTGVSAIVFAQRQHTVVGENGAVTVNVAGGNTQVLDYQRFVPGGALFVLSPPKPDGELKNITADFKEADFNGVDVSFDARQVVFSMKKNGNDKYHLYTAQLEDVDGKFELHQLTAGDYDDINPIYIAGGRIAFVTNQPYTEMGTRADEYNHGREVTQLATITVEGGDADRRLTSQNLSHTVSPFLRYDGKIGYSRWEHLGGVNDVKLFAANPDGTQMVAIAGQHDKPGTALFNVREAEPGVIIGIVTDRERTIHSGALVRIDARNHDDPACLDPKADQTGHVCTDEERAKYELLTPDVPTGMEPSPVGRYRTPATLPDGRILVSWAGGKVNDEAESSATPPDFGVYLFDPATKKNQLVYNTREAWEVNAVPVVTRKEPPVIGDLIGKSADTTQPVHIGSIDIKQTSLGDSVTGAQFDNTPLSEALRQATAVRIIEGFSSEASPGTTMFGLTMDDGAAVLGEAKIEADGSWFADIPPYVPVHLQPVDKFGLSIRNQRLWIQGMPGESRRCVGCHEGRTGQGVPSMGQNPTVSEQRTAQNFAIPIADRQEYPWMEGIQPILDAKCVSCHNGGASDPFAGREYTMSMSNGATGASAEYKVPYLLLTADPVTVYYDMEIVSYASSYVSLFYPSTAAMGMGATFTGDVPPMWAIPTQARASKLIDKLNVQAGDGTFAFSHGVKHPEDKGVDLTDAERQALIRAIDLGGQYYARKAAGFTPYEGGPVGGGPGRQY